MLRPLRPWLAELIADGEIDVNNQLGQPQAKRFDRRQPAAHLTFQNSRLIRARCSTSRNVSRAPWKLMKSSPPTANSRTSVIPPTMTTRIGICRRGGFGAACSDMGGHLRNDATSSYAGTPT